MRPRPILIAHRGASAVAPEGTRAAIRAAARAGADMVELDVQLTRDGRVIVFHDARLDRTTNGHGSVERMPYAAIARLDAGRWFHPRFAGERILLVSQALRMIPRRVRVNLELKRTARRQALVRRLLRVLRRTGGTSRLLLSSFEPRLLRPLTSGGLPLALICRRDADRSLTTAIRLGCAAWHPFHTLVTRRRLARAHAAGLRVHVWTVDRPAHARRLVRWGVDGLFTNDPARILRSIRPAR
jgi:glycerophosphoryl diester phosphodiesterase